ncbi:MAG TPA: hypothetical protein VLZ10_00935, partial [Thermodesulfobacteriota bacterium]|nr:hypothetical protein [Thermodesulfobacteriota bacterium]
GWWFPERKDLELLGWKESNLNILTDNGPPYDPAIGSTPLRAVLCRVHKVTHDSSGGKGFASD